MVDEPAASPMITKVSLLLEWDPPVNPQFPPQMYYVSISDADGNKKNIPVDINTTSYTYEVDITKDIPKLAMIGVSYPIGPLGVSEKMVSFNVLPREG